jgi:hypothetical protein
MKPTKISYSVRKIQSFYYSTWYIQLPLFFKGLTNFQADLTNSSNTEGGLTCSTQINQLTSVNVG